MKILFYLPKLVDGGAEKVIAHLAGWFARKGHNVSLAVDLAAGDNAAPLDPAVQLIELPQGHRASLGALAALLQEEAPEIAVSAIASANFKLTLSLMQARIRGLSAKKTPKLVLTYHGFEEYKTGRLSAMGYRALPLMSRVASRIVAVSDSLKEELATRWKARSEKLVRIYNPVQIPPPPTAFDPHDFSARDNLILSIGRLMPTKRFDLLIKGFADLCDASSRLVILGEGPERARLEALIEQLDLEDRVQLPGYVTDTGAWYAKAKCFALTSQTESFGLVLVEALAYGLPVVATRSGGPLEILKRGDFGVLLANEPSIPDLSNALARALREPGDAGPRIKRAARFDEERGAQRYQTLFEELTASP